MANPSSTNQSNTTKKTASYLSKNLKPHEDIDKNNYERGKKVSAIAEKISKILHQNGRTFYSFGLYLREYRTRKKLETILNNQHEHLTKIRLRMDSIERERAHPQQHIEQLENLIEETHDKFTQTIPKTGRSRISIEPLEHQEAEHYARRKVFRSLRQPEQKLTRKSSSAFEKFRDYLEHKRQEARELTEEYKQSKAVRRGSSRETAEQQSLLRKNQKEHQPLLERTKQSYEKYRQYIDQRMAHQLNRTQHLIARRQQHKTSHEQSQRQQRKQYNEQRSNLILAVLVFTLLVLVAISIVQLVV